MGVPPSRVGGKAYVKRFGTWNKALFAFTERVNEEPEIDSDDGQALAFATSGKTTMTRNLPAEDRRDIPIGLRYKVLRRDLFKCVLCVPTKTYCKRFAIWHNVLVGTHSLSMM